MNYYGEKSKTMKNENERIGFNLRGAVLRYQAKNPGVTQRDIAAKSGIHPVTFSRILNGDGTTTSTIQKIASAIGADAYRILEKGKKTPKYTARSLQEVVEDSRVLRQFVGETDQVGLEWANRELWKIVTALKNHRMKLQRERAYRV
jgi:transcriptional regulator with XRE-family HTH domain